MRIEIVRTRIQAFGNFGAAAVILFDGLEEFDNSVAQRFGDHTLIYFFTERKTIGFVVITYFWEKTDMKRILLLLMFNVLLASGQGGPPPPGCNIIAAIDPDGDGITQFDIAYYVNNVVRPRQLEQFGLDLSGYDLNFYGTNVDYQNGVFSNDIYTNIVNYQSAGLDYVYNGNGPEYTDPDSLSEFETCQKLYALAADGDEDHDGVLNGLEDLNGNLNIYDEDTDNDHIANCLDDDDDGDGTPTINEDYNGNGNWQDDDVNANGIPDYLDPSVTTLTLHDFLSGSMSVYPNPASDEITVRSLADVKISKIRIFDNYGKDVLEAHNPHQIIDISALESGFYWIMIADENQHSETRKLIIN